MHRPTGIYQTILTEPAMGSKHHGFWLPYQQATGGVDGITYLTAKPHKEGGLYRGIDTWYGSRGRSWMTMPPWALRSSSCTTRRAMHRRRTRTAFRSGAGGWTTRGAMSVSSDSRGRDRVPQRSAGGRHPHAAGRGPRHEYRHAGQNGKPTLAAAVGFGSGALAWPRGGCRAQNTPIWTSASLACTRC